MDKIIEEAKALRKDIDSLPEVQEYYRLKTLMENDEELKRLRLEIARLAKEGKTEEVPPTIKTHQVWKCNTNRTINRHPSTGWRLSLRFPHCQT